jgi:hypothetical protein
MDTIMDSDSDSESESESIMELENIIGTRNNQQTQQLEDDISKLLHIQSIKPSYKPHPYLFRVKLPQSQEKISESYNKPKPRPKYRHKEITSSSQSSMKPKPKQNPKPETLTLSEMLFDPAFDLSAPPIQLKEPTHIQLPNVLSSLTPESLMLSSSTIPFQGKIRASTAKNGKTKTKAKAKTKKSKQKAKKDKNKNAYKTPAPKTYRVHLTSNKGSRKLRSKSRSMARSLTTVDSFYVVVQMLEFVHCSRVSEQFHPRLLLNILARMDQYQSAEVQESTSNAHNALGDQ